MLKELLVHHLRVQKASGKLKSQLLEVENSPILKTIQVLNHLHPQAPALQFLLFLQLQTLQIPHSLRESLIQKIPVRLGLTLASGSGWSFSKCLKLLCKGLDLVAGAVKIDSFFREFSRFLDPGSAACSQGTAVRHGERQTGNTRSFQRIYVLFYNTEVQQHVVKPLQHATQTLHDCVW